MFECIFVWVCKPVFVCVLKCVYGRESVQLIRCMCTSMCLILFRSNPFIVVSSIKLMMMCPSCRCIRELHPSVHVNVHQVIFVQVFVFIFRSDSSNTQCRLRACIGYSRVKDILVYAPLILMLDLNVFVWMSLCLFVHHLFHVFFVHCD